MRFVLEIANHKNISKQRSARYILLHEQGKSSWSLIFLESTKRVSNRAATEVQVGK